MYSAKCNRSYSQGDHKQDGYEQGGYRKEKASNSCHYYSAQQSAIYLLSQRDHGTYELEQKLKVKGYGQQEIDAAIQFCSDNNYLSDLRYAQSQVRQNIYKGYGVNRIRQALAFKKVSSDLIAQALQAEQVDWFELAKEVAEKKFRGKKAIDQKEYAKQIRFLQYRGFSFDEISYALSLDTEPDNGDKF